MRSVRPVLRAFFLNAVTAFLIVGLLVGGGLWYVDYRRDQTIAAIPTIPDCETARAAAEREGRALTDDETRSCIESLDVAAPDAPLNIVLIGSDTRAFVDDEVEAQVFGEQDAGPARSDTLMVAHVDPRTKTGFIVSFPRDLYVDIPGVGGSKINAAYNGGPQRVIETLQTNFGIPINHYLEVDFKSFEQIVDAMGGVRLFFEYPVKDDYTSFVVLGRGCWELNGYQALGYVRSRSLQQLIDGEWRGDPVPDIARIARQQDFLKRLAAQVVAESESNPLEALDIADATIKYLKRNEDFRERAALGLVQAFADVNPYDPQSVQMTTFPWTTEPKGDDERALGGAGQVLYPNWPEAEPLLQALRGEAPPSATPGEVPGVAPAAVKVSVLNGSREPGQAKDVLDALQQQGFATIGVGNAPSATATTEVRYLPGAEDKARKVQSYLGGVGKLIEDPTITDADVVVVTGRDFRAVQAPAEPGAPPTTIAGTTTTAPVGVATTAPRAPDAPLPEPKDKLRPAEDVTRPEDC